MLAAQARHWRAALVRAAPAVGLVLVVVVAGMIGSWVAWFWYSVGLG
jgi:bacteriorhodopsin